jgi:hypothetical protein
MRSETPMLPDRMDFRMVPLWIVLWLYFLEWRARRKDTTVLHRTHIKAIQGTCIDISLEIQPYNDIITNRVRWYVVKKYSESKQLLDSNFEMLINVKR